MRKLMMAMLLAGTLGVLPNPAPAVAAYLPPGGSEDQVGGGCLNGSISSCDADFAGSSEKLAGIRGWCYMIRWGWCAWFD
jgi:hypothetical protein